MTRRSAGLTNSLTKGVLDPALSERIDLAHYYSGLADGLNLEVSPQGGVRRRPGTSLMSEWRFHSAGYKRRLRRRLQPLNVTSSMITVSNGGTKANLVDQNPATALVTNNVGASTFVVCQVDLGSAKPVCFVDVLGYSSASGRMNDAVSVEYSTNGSTWTELDGSGASGVSKRKQLSTVVRSRRFGEWPGGKGGVQVSARYWRVVLYSATSAGAVTVQGLRFWQEKNRISPVRLVSFARASDLVYEMAITDRNIDVFREQRYVASIPVDIDAPQIADLTFAQSLDTLLIFHADIQTQHVIRQGADEEWSAEPGTFTGVPNLTSGTSFSGDQDEVQDIVLGNISDGQQYVIWLGAKVSAPVTFARDTWLANFDAAMETVAGTTGVSTSALTGRNAARVRYYGSAGGRRWPVLHVVVLDDDEVDPETIVRQRGLDSAGKIMGETTGWPRCGVFYQERLIIGGFRAAPMTLGFSRLGDEYNFTSTADPFTTDLGFTFTLNSDQLDTIRRVHVGKHILLFTEGGEWYVESRELAADQPLNVLLANRYIIKPDVEPIMADGASLFLQLGGRVLRDMVYSDVELSYRAPPLSLLAPHLLTNVVSMAYRPQRDTGEGNQILLVNEDGSIAFMALLREQEVAALCQWRTAGYFRDVMADQLARVWLAVERETQGQRDLYLERLDGTHTLDAAVTYDRGGAAASVITDLEHLEGKTVWAWADRDLLGPHVVSGGSVTLPVKSAKATIGLPAVVYGALPKLRDKLANGQPFRPPGRIYEVGLSLAGTGQLDLAVNGGPFRDVPLPFGKDERALDIGMDRRRGTASGQGITSEVPGTQIEGLIHSLTMIPAAGEFSYATSVVTQVSPIVYENSHDDTGAADFVVSIGQARAALPALQNVSLFVAWFGDDLRCGSCTVRPKVETASKDTAPYNWSVGGLARASAVVMSQISGRPAYGGTPADESVVEAIQEMKAQGIAVTFTPFLMMDVPAGNTLTDPYDGSTGQPEYPWRGRITCSPAPGQPSTPDLTATAATQVAAFVGTCTAAHFAISGETVSYSGPAEWSYRRFILHCAHLCKAAGGVDTFVIGSEMRGLTWVRSAAGVYPFVDALVQLAADVKAVLGPTTKVTYAADWSEFAAHQTGVPGELYFHLDPLWSSSSIDAIGIDNYWPLSDWRDGDTHADWLAGAADIKERRYLQGNIAGGEGFDWYYASSGDRDDQVRTPITDGDYGKPWVWRYKDVKNWWLNAHYNRPAGVESASPTAWSPQSKPIWFMELGCPAADKGPNQPNVFYDPKSSESFFPYYSSGAQDEAVQRAYLEAFLGYWTPGEPDFEATRNPVSTVYGGRMVDPARLYVYTWDARFYPAFPQLREVWSDGDLWTYGHWITGRVYVLEDGTYGERYGLPVGLGADLPLRNRLITGTVRVTNLRGWSRHPFIEFSQSIPAPMEIRAIRYEVVTK